MITTQLMAAAGKQQTLIVYCRLVVSINKQYVLTVYFELCHHCDDNGCARLYSMYRTYRCWKKKQSKRYKVMESINFCYRHLNPKLL